VIVVNRIKKILIIGVQALAVPVLGCEVRFLLRSPTNRRPVARLLRDPAGGSYRLWVSRLSYESLIAGKAGSFKWLR
jgi:hypothetical protein